MRVFIKCLCGEEIWSNSIHDIQCRSCGTRYFREYSQLEDIYQWTMFPENNEQLSKKDIDNDR